ncbi:hypothetical protein DER45DRAFT_580559 [Fusarium avenaceum]|nr:hypothetical protein DER45DRAFT_580559 [Fusarium avenaceum]
MRLETDYRGSTSLEALWNVIAYFVYRAVAMCLILDEANIIVGFAMSPDLFMFSAIYMLSLL